MEILKIAIPEFSGRISPMFDVAGKFYLFVLNNRSICEEKTINTEGIDEFSKINMLCKESVNVVICDSISLCAAGHIVCSGLQLFPNNSGTIAETIERYLFGELKTEREYFRKRPCMNRKRIGRRQGKQGCKNILFEDIK